LDIMMASSSDFLQNVVAKPRILIRVM